MADYSFGGPLAAYLQVRDNNKRLGIAQQEMDIRNATAMTGIVSHLQALKDSEDLQAAIASGDPNRIARTKGGMGILAQAAQIQNAGTTGQLNTARIGELNRKGEEAQRQTQAQGALARLLSGGGYQDATPGAPPPTSVIAPSDPNAPESPELLAQLREADKSGQPVRIDSPNINNVKALSVLASPKDAVRSILAPASGSRIAPRQVADETSGTGWSWMDASGKKTPGAPPPFSPKANADPAGAGNEDVLTPSGEKVKNDLISHGLTVPKTRRGQIDNAALNSLGRDRDAGAPPVSSTRADYGANKGALAANTKDLASIRPYNEMLETNGNIAMDLADKVVKTDLRFANKSANWLRQNAGDNPDVAEFLAQTQIVSTEAARVLNNPRLVGQLTDSARHEMQGIINGDMPINSYKRVIQRMQSDGRNRVSAMMREHDSLQQALGGQPVPTTAVTAPAPAPASNIDALLKKYSQ